ncbi:lipoprotein insertase outer membrane protein LolB [Aliikangiella maris]
MAKSKMPDSSNQYCSFQKLIRSVQAFSRFGQLSQLALSGSFNSLMVAALIMTLGGCQTAPTKISGQIPSTLADIHYWDLKARVAIKTAEDSVTATLDWKKRADDFNFHLYGTFGVTYAQLSQQGYQAKLELPDDQTFYHQNAQQLLYQSLGWDFPIEALSYWVKGQPSNLSGELVTRDNSGQLSLIYFNDWQVSFQNFQDFQGQILPKIIKATHPQMSMKVVLKSWQPLPDNSNLSEH